MEQMDSELRRFAKASCITAGQSHLSFLEFGVSGSVSLFTSSRMKQDSISSPTLSPLYISSSPPFCEWVDRAHQCMLLRVSGHMRDSPDYQLAVAIQSGEGGCGHQAQRCSLGAEPSISFFSKRGYSVPIKAPVGLALGFTSGLAWTMTTLVISGYSSIPRGFCTHRALPM